MISLMKLLALLALASIDLQDTNSFTIPSQYENETVVVLHTVDTQGEMDFVCGKALEGYHRVGCAKSKEIFMRNPCFDPEAKDVKSYAHKLCHEIAHTEGWHHVNE